MATYKKKLKTITVHQMLDGATVEIADTASDDKATRALNEFKKYETMHYETESGGEKVTNAIPYHAVQYIEVTEAEADITKADPYGCDDADADTYTVTFKVSGTTCGCEDGTVVGTMSVKKGESLILPTFTEKCENISNVWFDGEDSVGQDGDSYTPTSDITLITGCPQE